MRFARYYAHGEVAYGVVEDGMVKQITTTPFEDYQVTDHTHPLDHVQLLAPVVPGNVVTDSFGASNLMKLVTVGDGKPGLNRMALASPSFEGDDVVVGPR